MNLPDIQFADLDPAIIEKEVFQTYETITGQTLFPGDPVRLFLESLAYTLCLQNNLINLAGKQNLLAFAEKGHLDHLGALVGTKRLGSSFAQSEQAFYLQEALAFDVHIPQGTRITSKDGKVIFITEKTLTIEKGKDFGTVSIVSIEAGAVGNGFISGQINTLIDPVAYVNRTENTCPSFLGANIENDTRYRERIQLAPEAYTNAGSYGAYTYHSLKAHQDILSVAVFCPTPGTVDIRPLMTGGELPSEEILQAVRAKVSADDVRPLTDTVHVKSPEAVEYSVHVKWALEKSKSALSASVKKKIDQSVENYRMWQRSAVGRDISPTKLISMLEQAGAKRVDVIKPSFIKLEAWQIARETSVICEFLGVEDE